MLISGEQVVLYTSVELLFSLQVGMQARDFVPPLHLFSGNLPPKPSRLFQAIGVKRPIRSGFEIACVVVATHGGPGCI